MHARARASFPGLPHFLLRSSVCIQYNTHSMYYTERKLRNKMRGGGRGRLPGPYDYTYKKTFSVFLYFTVSCYSWSTLGFVSTKPSFATYNTHEIKNGGFHLYLPCGAQSTSKTSLISAELTGARWKRVIDGKTNTQPYCKPSW